MTVIPIRGRRRSPHPVEAPRALSGTAPSAPAQTNEDTDFYRLRAQQNWAVLILVLALVVCGAWLIERLKTYSRAMACYEFGHHNCMPLDVEPPPR